MRLTTDAASEVEDLKPPTNFLPREIHNQMAGSTSAYWVTHGHDREREVGFDSGPRLLVLRYEAEAGRYAAAKP